MEIPGELRDRIAAYGELGRWDRAELGRSLRRHGLSYGEIMELIPVPKGTLASWCRDIRLSEELVAAIKERRGPREAPRDTQWRRRLEIERIQGEARQFALDHLHDPLWVGGTVLYWGEGSKTIRALELTNSDPRALRLFIAWTRSYLDPDPKLTAALNLHAGNDEPHARLWWSRQLGIALRSFNKTYVKPDGTGHRKNHLEHGVCRVRVRRSTDAFLRTMIWIDVVAAELATSAREGFD